MTAHEEKRLQELVELIEKEKDPDVLQTLAAELYLLLTKQLEDLKKRDDG
jgi:DNA replication initiation complex subunit (GINS family)